MVQLLPILLTKHTKVTNKSYKKEAAGIIPCSLFSFEVDDLFNEFMRCKHILWIESFVKFFFR